MAVILETERLLLREMTENDSTSLAEILQDEQTMYAYEGAFSQEETQEWLNKQLLGYKQNGFGLWAVVRKETSEMIGQCGLTWQAVQNYQMLEVGYLFNRGFWHHGYAIEAAKAVKEYGFCKVDAAEIGSIIRDTNIASMNVAIRNGMLVRGRFVKHYRGMDMPHLVFSVKR